MPGMDVVIPPCTMLILAVELCDGVDNDCNGEIDDDCVAGDDDDSAAGDDDDSAGDDDDAPGDDDDSGDGDDDDISVEVLDCSGCGAAVAGTSEGALLLPLAALALAVRRRRMSMAPSRLQE